MSIQNVHCAGVRGAQRGQQLSRPDASAGMLLQVDISTRRRQSAAALPDTSGLPDNSGNPNKHRIQRLSPDDYRAMKGVSDLTEPSCDKCKLFFLESIFPSLRSGATPCSHPAKTKAELDYCNLWESRLDSNSEGMAAVLKADFVGSDGICEEELAEEACLTIDKCRMTACEVCQEAVLTKPLSDALAHLKRQCQAMNEEKEIQVTGCKVISSMNSVPPSAANPAETTRQRACWDLKFCAPDEPQWAPPSCTIVAAANENERKKNWLSHEVQRTCHYKYRAKISQTGTQSQQMGQKTYTETEKKDSWMSADVEIRYTGKVDGGLNQNCKKQPKGNRPVCALMDPLVGEKTKKKKHFCQARGLLGMWCSKQAHCNAKTQFCDVVASRCVKKMKSKTSTRANVCTANFMCLSNRCDVHCVECNNQNDDGCRSDKFCHVGICTRRRGYGGSCLRDRVCQSGMCVNGFCVECKQDSQCISTTEPERSWLKKFDGECESGKEIRMFDGTGDNEGTEDEVVERCAKACLDRTSSPKAGSWTGFDAKGFIVKPPDVSYGGRCYCEDASSATCTKSSSSSDYDRYDFVDKVRNWVKTFDGECNSGKEIRMFDGTGDNEGTEEEVVDRCANACLDMRYMIYSKP